MVTQLPDESIESTKDTGCPDLGIKFDRDTRYGYPSAENHCHGVKTAEKVNLAHQISFCLTSEYLHCPVFQGEGETRLPDEIRAEVEEALPIWIPSLAWGIVVVLSIIMAIVFLVWRRAANLSQTIESGIVQPTNTTQVYPTHTTQVQPTIEFQDDLAEVGVFATQTHTNTPQNTSTPTLFIETEPTDLSDSTLTPTPTPTPGPGLETPFGDEKKYLIHKVSVGESMPSLARRFETNLEVISAVNRLGEAFILLVDQIIIVMPGTSDLVEVVPLVPIFLDIDTKLADIATEYNISEEKIQALNDLGGESMVSGGRWLVVPVEEVIPTSLPSPTAMSEFSTALKAPFGPNNEYLLHKVKAGESLAVLERLYLTSAEVIQKVNQLDYSLQVNQVLVIILNQVDPTELPVLNARLVENQTSVEDFADQLYILPSVIYELNGIEDGMMISAGEWVIYPE